jgi:hypothetical protein
LTRSPGYSRAANGISGTQKKRSIEGIFSAFLRVASFALGRGEFESDAEPDWGGPLFKDFNVNEEGKLWNE